MSKPAGKDAGSSVVIRGLVNPTFEIEGELYTPEHLREWLNALDIMDVVRKLGRARVRLCCPLEAPPHE